METLNLKDFLHKEIPENKLTINVTGAYHAGQSSFVASLSERVWTDVEIIIGTEKPYTIQITVGDSDALLLLELPPAIRWWNVIEDVGLKEVFAGTVIVLHSARPETFREAKSILDTYHAFAAVPYIVAANGQNHPEAWSIDDLRATLKLHKDVRILPCVATDPNSVEQVVMALLDMISDNPLAEEAASKLLKNEF